MFSSGFPYRHARPPKRQQAQRPRPTFRPRLESLEDRTLLNSRFVVAVGAPVDNASSFAALQAALTTPGLNAGDVIQIEPGAAPGDVSLSTNLPPVASLTIQGDATAALASIPQFTLSDAFTIQAAQAGFTLKNVNVGLVGGGGITFQADGAITRSAIVDVSSGASNVISVTTGRFALTDSTVVNNNPRALPTLVSVTPAAGASNLIEGNVFIANALTAVLVAYQYSAPVTVTDQVIDNAFIYNVPSGPGALFSEFGLIDGLSIIGNTFTDSVSAVTAIALQNGSTNTQIGGNVIQLTGAGSIGVSMAPGIVPFSALVAGNQISTAGAGTGLSMVLPKGFLPNGGVLTPGLVVQGNDFHENQIGVYINVPSSPPVISLVGIDLGGGSQGSLGGNDFRGIPAAHFTPGLINQGEGNFGQLSPGTGTGAIIVEGVRVTQATVAAHQNIFSGDPKADVFSNNATIDTSGALTGAAAWVASSYDLILRRAGDLNSPNDAGGCISALNNGELTQAAVADALVHSQEKAGQLVDGLFMLLLNRPADAPGKASFVQFLRNGGTLEEATVGILASPEYALLYGSDDAFVQSLYSKVLGRTGSSDEAAGWINAAPILGRAGVANGFLRSPEFRGDVVQQLYGFPAASVTTVAGLFPSLLHRMGTSAEVSGWVNSSLDLLSIEADFAGAPEFALPG